MKEKPNAPHAAVANGQDCDATRAKMDAAVEKLRGTECLVLYGMEQVRAFLEIRGRLDGYGLLRQVRIDCCDDRATVQMGNLLLVSGGFDWIFELPPVTRAD